MRFMMWCMIAWIVALSSCFAADFPAEYSWVLTDDSQPYLSDPIVTQASGREKAQALGLLYLMDDPKLVPVQTRICAELFKLEDSQDSQVLEKFLKTKGLWGQLRILFKSRGAPSVNWLISRYQSADTTQRTGIVVMMVELNYQEVYNFLFSRLDDKVIFFNPVADAYGQTNNERIADFAYAIIEGNLRMRKIELPASVPRNGTSIHKSIEERDVNIASLKAAWASNAEWKAAVMNVPSASGQ